MLAAQEYPRLTSVNEQQRNFTLALISHLLFALLFIFFIPLHLIDNDHGLGIRVFQGFIDLNALGIFQDNAFYSETGERFFRLVLFFISFALVWGLYSVKLITPSTLGLYFMWPYAAYLATRMKVEFIVFPFYMIRTDLKWRHEALLIMAMLLLGELIGERNFQLFAIFRVALVIYSRVNSPKLFIIGAIVAAVGIELSFDVLATLNNTIARFNYTRTIANPNYSVIESAGVLVASHHLSINPTQGWMIHLPFGALLLLLSLPDIIRHAERRAMFSGLGVYLVMTSLTHAFQKASYYLFFLPAVYTPIYERRFALLFAVSWMHVLVAILFYQFLTAQ